MCVQSSLPGAASIDNPYSNILTGSRQNALAAIGGLRQHVRITCNRRNAPECVMCVLRGRAVLCGRAAGSAAALPTVRVRSRASAAVKHAWLLRTKQQRDRPQQPLYAKLRVQHAAGLCMPGRPCCSCVARLRRSCVRGGSTCAGDSVKWLVHAMPEAFSWSDTAAR